MRKPADPDHRRFIYFIVCTTCPVVILGLPFDDSELFNWETVMLAVMAPVGAAILTWIAR
jgi:undecaprenyl pyrophosphate phosphatase UppP